MEDFIIYDSDGKELVDALREKNLQFQIAPTLDFWRVDLLTDEGEKILCGVYHLRDDAQTQIDLCKRRTSDARHGKCKVINSIARLQPTKF